MKSKLVFLGPPGSGKGTAAQRVAPKVGVPQISTGDILRGHVKRGTEIGEKSNPYMNRGELVPDDIVIGMVKERIAQPDCANGFIFDGFPRTLVQAEALGAFATIDAVVNLAVSEDIIIARLSSRVSCKKCQQVYNTRTMPPKEEGKCDKCEGELFQRDDDKAETVKDRLKEYEAKTAPLIEYYRGKGLLVDVVIDDINSPPQETVDKIMAAIQ